METRIKALWVNRLRAETDQQGRGKLNKDGKLCCLGVLCEIAVAEGVIDSWLPSEGLAVYYGKRPPGSGFSYIDSDYSASQLPRAVAAWAGITTSPAVPTACATEIHPIPIEAFSSRVGDDVTLIHLNDTAEFTFPQIADVIEACL